MSHLKKIARIKMANGRSPSRRCSVLLLSVSFLCAINNALAHEFWLEPSVADDAMDSSVAVHLFNGQQFSGEAMPYIPQMIDRFTIIDAEKRTPVVGNIGDMPIMLNNLKGAGLHTLQYESVQYQLKHSSIEKFEQYALEEGVQQVLNEWRESTTHTGPVHESYRRFAKSLFSRGTVAGNDSFSGMLFELVALENPFDEVAKDTIPIELLYDGNPLAGAQITVYSKSLKYPSIRRTFVSNDKGIVHVPRSSNTKYLINAVHLRKTSLLERFLNGAHFNSLWASLMFKTPAT